MDETCLNLDTYTCIGEFLVLKKKFLIICFCV